MTPVLLFTIVHRVSKSRPFYFGSVFVNIFIQI